VHFGPERLGDRDGKHCACRTGAISIHSTKRRDNTRNLELVNIICKELNYYSSTIIVADLVASANLFPVPIP